MSTVFALANIYKSFGRNKEVPVIVNATLQIKKGEIVALIGKSGSGKSTLLHIAGLLDTPSSGSILLNNIECTDKTSDKDKTYLRRHFLGFIYQFHHLLQEFSVLENVMLPQIITGKSKSIAKKNAMEILERVRLQDKLSMPISQLSGGERQRVAIARSLINCPLIVLADEPTGSLDNNTALEVFSLLQEYAKEKNIAILLATHNYSLAQKACRIVKIDSGILRSYSIDESGFNKI
ncbi:ABC transporter family protein [Ehrlichia chaffeensis str. Heartland]|uniref:Lipoprotein-releasing system ATP-binding protein LolD n=1 Tax=Ehrlichia chaffeensis (strain ATCC CRL-10679 / Arkansas) TaxID=205920 RepID=LOLD_EHRCR|nr:ABC transporter ATP-binding protein [Ehrlichia chaffeensis]Q2GHT4.1 RecName: Full=Lipoprotein-releasing system ATP-binding protein LolD [Ehrlichia chaffeensis str. Arkansas]ABD44785.1 ABC transporter, ATP-binding protein [Ehrlichia chaffeensis str. Arkansas]AHX04032.1 ABC transporter family protein [Ehrlichia chaffeensis str. Heartland]AHX05966.1 ABC transporter family protein [Ehrlichia chaffeensis str. Jax]AHX06956.1 ABC transporter family protein [Ehrlichia chaffeensis str. Liberty]AHX0